MSAEARLRYYAGVFDTVEVNSSYYAIPDPLNARRWAERTPPPFIFHAKAYAHITSHHPRPQTLPAHVLPTLPPNPLRPRPAPTAPAPTPPDAPHPTLRRPPPAPT